MSNRFKKIVSIVSPTRKRPSGDMLPDRRPDLTRMQVRAMLSLTLTVGWLALAVSVATAQCPGDCDGDNVVAINEVITGVGIGLGLVPLAGCLAMDADRDQSVAINEVISAVNNGLGSCPPLLRTRTATPLPSPPTPTIPIGTPGPLPTLIGEPLYVRGGAGNDGNDGRSPAQAFRTISRAVSRLRDGQILVVGPGVYNEAILDPPGGTAAVPRLFLADPTGERTGDGAAAVVIDASGVEDAQRIPAPAIRISGAPFVVIDGFQLVGGATAGIHVRLGSDRAAIRNCEVFRNSGDGILVQSSLDVTLFNNLIYENTRRGIAVVGSPESRVVHNTIVANEDAGLFIGTRGDRASTNAVLRNNIVQDNVAANVQVTTEPENSVVGYDSLSNLVFPAQYEPGSLPRRLDIDEDAGFESALRGNFRLGSESPAIDAATNDALNVLDVQVLRARSATADGAVDDDGRFDLGYHYPAGSSPPVRGPQRFYVRDRGNDTEDGLSPNAAFQTIERAIRDTIPGDHVIVGPGRYEEGPLSPTSGTSSLPVLLQGDPSGNLTGDPSGQVLVEAGGAVAAFRLSGVEFVTLDGFTVAGGEQSGIQIRSGSSDVTVQNCKVVANDDGIRIEDSQDVLIFNNLIIRNQRRGVLVAGTVSGSRGTRLIHNTLSRNGDRGIFIGSPEIGSRDTLVQNNIVQENGGTGIQVTEGSADDFVARYNLLFPLASPDAYFPRDLPRTEDVNQSARFVSTADGDFFLEQGASPAVNSGDSDLAAGLRALLAERTTDPNGRPDGGRVDRGFHFPP